MNFFNSVVNFFKDGGIFLYPLALIFVVGVSIAIERYLYLTRETIRNRGLWDDLVPALSTGNFKQVVGLTQNSKASIATILNYGVARVASARRRDDTADTFTVTPVGGGSATITVNDTNGHSTSIPASVTAATFTPQQQR